MVPTARVRFGSGRGRQVVAEAERGAVAVGHELDLDPRRAGSDRALLSRLLPPPRVDDPVRAVDLDELALGDVAGITSQ